MPMFSEGVQNIFVVSQKLKMGNALKLDDERVVMAELIVPVHLKQVQQKIASTNSKLAKSSGINSNSGNGSNSVNSSNSNYSNSGNGSNSNYSNSNNNNIGSDIGTTLGGSDNISITINDNHTPLDINDSNSTHSTISTSFDITTINNSNTNTNSTNSDIQNNSESLNSIQPDLYSESLSIANEQQTDESLLFETSSKKKFLIIFLLIDF